MATPYVAISFDEVGSTQDVAAEQLMESSIPVLIVARRQRTGRGRHGNEWWQAPRAVAASLAFRDPALPVAESFSLAVALAIRTAVSQVSGIDVALKWPNDLEVAGQKVGGILVERDETRTVVGCGLNLWWPEPPEGATGIYQDDPGDDVGMTISRAWTDHLFATGASWDRAAYLDACSTLGKDVTWEPDGSGNAVDVDSDGGLVVATAAGRTTLRSGEISTVRS